jgi:putative addiction module component (TIGR02574 family)
MSKEDILEELPKLSLEDRMEIQAKLEALAVDDWLDADDPLEEEQKKLIEARLNDLDHNPENAIPWSQAEARLKIRFGA